MIVMPESGPCWGMARNPSARPNPVNNAERGKPATWQPDAANPRAVGADLRSVACSRAAPLSYPDCSLGRAYEQPISKWRRGSGPAEIGGADRLDHHFGAGYRRSVASSRAAKQGPVGRLSDVGPHELCSDRGAFAPLECH